MRNFSTVKKMLLLKLYLKTPQTELKDEIRIGYPSIESLAKKPRRIRTYC
jgi:hypothetical protein